MTKIEKSRSQRTRDKLKEAASELFIERGIDNVSVRDIVSAAGQRNIGSIAYYFESKEALVRELLIDGAKIVDARRIEMLNELEKGGKPVALRDVVSVLVKSSLVQDPAVEMNMRFFNQFFNKRELYLAAIGGQLNSGYRRCVDYFRDHLKDQPRQLASERIIVMLTLVSNVLAMREVSLHNQETDEERNIFGSRAWTSPSVIESLIDSCVGVLSYPISEQAVRASDDAGQIKAE